MKTNIEKIIWDMAEFNASVIAKEHEEKTKDCCPYCGKKMKLKLFFNHNDETLWEDICSKNCQREGDFESFYY